MFRFMPVAAFFLAAVLLPVCQASAAQYMFFQPSVSDKQITPEKWRDIWRDSKDNGINSVIVQWTRYGDIDFGGKDGWLVNALRDANAAGLDLVMGLYMDPAYYRRLSEIDAAAYDAYLQYALGQSLKQAEVINAQWNLPIAGWYVPLELDDWNYSQASQRTRAKDLLVGLSDRLDAPVHVSTYAGGKVASQVYGDWIDALSEKGLHVWAQDGAGTGALPDLVRQSYLDAIPCSAGIVLEAFKQTSDAGDDFKAVPVDDFAALKRQNQCHELAFFELRYLPWGRDLLSKHLNVSQAPTS